MADTSVWLDSSTTTGKIKVIRDKYNNVVTKSLKIGEVLYNYICYANKWNDENAEVVAKWWNQEKGTGGNLVWKEGAKKLVIEARSSGTYDGEDRVKIIAQACARLYWLACCRPMVSLESSFKDTVNAICATELAVGKDETYKSKFLDDNFRGTVWTDMMENKFDATTWASLVLNRKMEKGSSKQQAIENMISDLRAKIATLRTATTEYCTEIDRVAKNTDPTQYWGLDATSMKDVNDSIGQIKKMLENRLNDLTDNLDVALSASLTAIGADINKLKLLSK